MSVKAVSKYALTLIPSALPVTEDALVLLEQTYFGHGADIDISVSGGAKVWFFNVVNQVKFLQETQYTLQRAVAIVAMPKGATVSVNYQHNKVRKFSWLRYYFGDKRLVVTKHTFQVSHCFNGFNPVEPFLSERKGETIVESIV
ncbi:MAG: hypothetical protein JSS83_28730 [Cyanobacteria bacterium SZAS LIN-3]|nr:hypothetical protein [Cyanobacteria bacterium SZAS LIN-3]MBS2005983.1 hypothetical protein [Cyanobacteria bacterium SZAS TMP-1]